MADYLPAYERMIRREGGYRLTNDPADRGGMTFAGISRNRWPDWEGWRQIDAGGEPEAEDVRAFYRAHPVYANRLQHAIKSLRKRYQTGCESTAILRRGRLTASYMHFYFPSNPEAVARLFLP